MDMPDTQPNRSDPANPPNAPSGTEAMVTAPPPAKVQQALETPVERPFVSHGSEKRDSKTPTMLILGALSVVACLAVGFGVYKKITAPTAPRMVLEKHAAASADKTEVPPAPAPAAVAPPPSTPASATVTPVAFADGANSCEDVSTLHDEIDRLSEELRTSKAKLASLAKKPRGSPVQDNASEEVVAMTILDISTKAVVVVALNQKYTVLPGSLLPGGATFIGYNPSRRLMVTDHGDFPIR